MFIFVYFINKLARVLAPNNSIINPTINRAYNPTINRSLQSNNDRK